MSKEQIVLLGFGDIATRLLSQPLLYDYHITGVRRSNKNINNNNALGPTITSVAADCTNIDAMNQLFSSPVDVLVMTFTPSEMSDSGYKAGYVDTVKAVLKALHNTQSSPRLLLFVSSTSVYGQRDACWVNEESPTEPSSYSGKRLLEAEQLVANSGHPYCCVRFSGIYGPGRHRLIEQVIAGKGSPKKPILYSNRIHADDCAGILAHLIEQQKTQTIDTLYLASDCQPTPLHDVKLWIAHQLSLTDNHLETDSTTATITPERMLRSSKRCSNKKIVETGYIFLYPTFKEGYGEVLKGYNLE